MRIGMDALVWIVITGKPIVPTLRPTHDNYPLSALASLRICVVSVNRSIPKAIAVVVAGAIFVILDAVCSPLSSSRWVY